MEGLEKSSSSPSVAVIAAIAAGAAVQLQTVFIARTRHSVALQLLVLVHFATAAPPEDFAALHRTPFSPSVYPAPCPRHNVMLHLLGKYVL